MVRLEYEQIATASLSLWASGRVYGRLPRSCYRCMAYNNKIAFLTPESDKDGELWQRIETRAGGRVNSHYCPTVYVSQKSKIPRDILRNSGYRIVMDPDKANITIIPQKFEDFDTEKWAIVVRDGIKLYLIDIYKKDWYSWTQCSISQTHIDNIDNYIHNELFPGKEIDIYHNTDLSKFTIAFVPKIPEYDDILMNNYPNRRYVLDNLVTVTPAVDINVETLLTWSMCNDKTILEKSVVNSNWMKYPFTVGIFLASEKQHEVVTLKGSPQFRRVLDAIHYFDIIFEDDIDQITVEPEDFDMLQRWIYYKLGVDENGGWTSGATLSKLSEYYREVLQSRIAIRPMRLQHPIDYQSIMDKVEI